MVLNRVREGKGTFGYNAATGEYGDMVEMGILDPTKVTRLALQNAASVAGLLLTTEVMIAESPKEEEHAHGAPAAWAAWAAWTCNTGFCRLQSKESGLRPAPFCAPDEWLGLRVLLRSSSCAHAIAITPAELLGACVAHFPTLFARCMLS